MTEADEGIDPRHWLPPNHPLVTPERCTKGDLEAEHTERGGMQVRSFAFPLDFLLNRGSITPEQYNAGNTLHGLWSATFRSQYRLMSFGPSQAVAATDFEALRQMAIRYVRAIEAVRGTKARRVACLVCCYGVTVSRVPGFGSTSRAREVCMPLLKSALDDLHEHFRQK